MTGRVVPAAGGMPNFNRVSLYVEQKEAQVLFELLVSFSFGGRGVGLEGQKTL